MSDYQPKKLPSQWISIQEATRHAPYSQEYLSLLARRGKIFAKKIGRNWYTTHEALERYISEQTLLSPIAKQFSPTVELASSSSNLVEEFKRLNPQVFGQEKKQELGIRNQELGNTKQGIESVPSVLPNVAPAPVTIPTPTIPVIPQNNSENKVLEKLDRLSDSLETFTSSVTASIPAITQANQSAPLNPEVEEFVQERINSSIHRFRHFDRFAKSTTRSPVRLMAVMITAVVLIFVLIGGFSFGKVDAVAQKIKKAFNDATTIDGHFAGTHANEVLILDKAGNISIYGHIETEGQFRSHAPEGVAPIVVDSLTKVENLNADYIDNLSSQDFTLAFVTKNGNLTYEDVHLMGDVEVGKLLKVGGDAIIGKTLTVSGATKLMDSLTVYGKLGVLSDAVFGKDVTLTNGDLVISKGTIKISNMTLIKNLNAEYLDGVKKGDINLNFVTSNGNTTSNSITVGGLTSTGTITSYGPGFFNSSIWSPFGSFGDLGVGKSASFGDSKNPSNSKFEVYSSKFSLDANGNARLAGTTTTNNLLVSGSVLSGLIPSGSFDLGSLAQPWVNLYAIDGNFSGDITVSGSLNFAGTTSSSFVINTDNTASDSEDAYLAFSRGSITPDAKLTWNSTFKQFEFNEPVNIASSSFTVEGNTFLNNASVSNNFEVVGTASISGTTTLAGQTYTWPSSQTTNGFLKTNGTGTLSWSTAFSGTIASLSQNFDPATDNQYDLGDPSYRWRTGYFGTSIISPFASFTNASVSNNFEIGNIASIGGNATIGGTLGVTGNTTLTGTLTGNSIGSNSFQGSLDVALGLHAVGNVTTLAQFLSSGTGSNSFAGSLDITKGLRAAQITGTGLTLNGNTNISGTLNVIGQSNFSNASASSGFESTYLKTDTISNSTGTLTINAFTLGGLVTGNNQSITGLNQLTSSIASISTNFEVGGYASIGGNTTLAGQTYTWPSSQTTNGFLKTNGSGTLSWSTAFAGTIASLSQNFDPATDNQYDLGDPSYRWRTGYFGTSLGINNGGTLNTAFEVGGTASISNTLTLGGIITSTNTGSNSFAGSIELTKGFRFGNLTQTGTGINYFAGNVGIGTNSPTSLFTVQGRGEFQGTASASYFLTGNTIQVGGFSSASYNRFGTGTTNHANYISTSNDVLVSGDLEILGTASFEGNVVIGATSTTTLAVGSTVKSDLIPFTNAYNLGSTTNHWGTLYVDTANITTLEASTASISGTTARDFLINSDNASADAEDMSVTFKRGLPTVNAALEWDSTNKRFNLNFPIFVQTVDNPEPSYNFTQLVLKGAADQSSNDYFQIKDSSDVSKFRISDNGASFSVPFELSNTASISNTLTLGGIITSTNTGSNSFSGGLEVTKGIHATGSITSGGDLRINGNANLNGVFVFGDNGDVGSINTNDWDIAIDGALTGISFNANGTGNSISNIDNGDLTADTLDFTAISDSPTLDADLYIQRAGFKIGIGKTPSTVFEVQGTASASYGLFGTLQIGAFSSTSYNRFGTTTTGHSLSASNDLLISGDLEVDGSAYFDGSTIFGAGASISGNFDPATDNTYDLGDASYRWQTGYFGTSLGINNGGTLDTAFEVGGTASISNTLTLGGIITSTNTGSNSFSGSINLDKGLHTTGNVTTLAQFLSSGTGSNSFAGSLNISKSLTATNSVTAGSFVTAGNLTVGGNEVLTGTFTGNSTGSNSFAGSLDIIKGLRSANFTQVGSAPNYFNGNVGIGTTAPNITAYAGRVLTVGSGTSAEPAIEIYGGRTGSDGIAADMAFLNSYATGADKRIALIRANRITDDNSGGLQFYSRNAGTLVEALRIDKTGNVGIGTTGPGNKLSFGANNSAQIISLYESGNTKVTIGTNDGFTFAVPNTSNNNFKFGTLSTADGTTFSEKVRIDNSGNVGIGTTGPSELLEVSKSTASGNTFIRITNTDTSADGGEGAALALYEAGTLRTQFTSNFQDQKMYLYHRGDNRVTIDNVGNVGIGTTVPGQALEVGGTGKVKIAALTTQGYVCVGGNPGAGVLSDGGASCSTSDARLKIDITPISDSLNVLSSLNQLHGVYYRWDLNNPRNEGMPSSRQIGMIAQDVEQVLPELVSVGSDGYRSLDYPKFTGFLLEAVKELDNKTNALTGQFEAFTSKLEAQCVTGDTRLRRRRKRARPDADVEGEFDFDEVEIKDIVAGDEIQSLNEATGRVEFARVNALMDMGVQEVYELVTKSGRKIRTTKNHPYLVKLGS
ncbi:MAG: hypothetical protein A2735_01215 [Candidatus Yanofskybacteria bacterium RIFCSPHIGHO2_01_FULL_41_21]|uniref:Peptidase S74 domain-containing protein n=1 Tax=Candidatus Yanofskybacteria bacterium RIFCSPHIGHO2_01_FULL_41_21 TaxID=1802660 RepID=A0A1F8EAI8_9BACT|nr:MAG: hypothetical protein A2735_01215 [Candidatus Yanofskybacteria bacterium RIFCSPHIGHO2_01_FULL_41_21]